MKKIETERIKKYFSGYSVFWLLLFGIVGLRLVLSVVYTLPQFDGGMNLQVPLNMMENGVYGTLYNGGTPFDIVVQTGLPVLFPVYLMFLLFGAGFSQALFVNAVYFVLLLWLTDRIGRKLGMREEWRLVSLMAVFLVRKIYVYSMSLYGEVPAAMWLLACVYFLMKYEEKEERRWLLLSGLSYGLALLTKTVLFIAVPSLIVVFISKIFVEKKLKIRDVCGWVLTCAIPYVLFIIYKFVVLGTGEFQTLTNRLLGGIMKQAGVAEGYSDTAGSIFDKFAVHMGILSEYLRVPAVIIFIALAANLIYLAYHIIKRKHLVYFEILALVAYSYFGWWLLITSTAKAWERRIFIGLLLMLFVMVWNLSRCEKLQKLMERKWAFPVLLSVLILGVYVRQVPEMLKVDYTERKAIEADGAFIRELAAEELDAVFCGNGWWQAPIVSFAAGMDFYDINNVRGNHVYYVKDRNEKKLGGDAFKLLGEQLDMEKIYSNAQSETTIYKVSGLETYEPFTEEAREEVDVQEISKDMENDLTRGLYPYEADAKNRWAEQEAGFLLDAEEGTNELEFRFRVANYEQMDEKPMQVVLYVNGEAAAVQKVEQDGEYVMTATTEWKDGNEGMEVYVYATSHLLLEGDSRELSYLFEGLRIR